MQGSLWYWIGSNHFFQLFLSEERRQQVLQNNWLSCVFTNWWWTKTYFLDFFMYWKKRGKLAIWPVSPRGILQKYHRTSSPSDGLLVCARYFLRPLHCSTASSNLAIFDGVFFKSDNDSSIWEKLEASPLLLSTLLSPESNMVKSVENIRPYRCLNYILYIHSTDWSTIY